mmetsp:Transcript_7549/g.13809  ORF Transcript_7549/g.13809 Transcript_7549/m.13809 type:complete len:379 (-) Transcript_7549:3417-4553(-)
MSESLDGRQCSSMDEITRDSFLLHNDKTRYERKLQRCVLAFASTVTDECQSIADLNIFSKYVSENYQNVCSRADKFLVDVIKDRATQKSINQVVTMHLIAFKQFGITISTRIRDQIQNLRENTWRKIDASRFDSYHGAKISQYDARRDKWPELIKYLSNTDPKTFRGHLERAASANTEGCSKASIQEMMVVSRKPDYVLKQYLLMVRATLSLLRATGMRGVSLCTIKREDFEDLDNDGEQLLTRIERKCGSTRNITKRVSCKLVHHINPEQCPLIHLGEYLHLTQHESTCREYIFSLGFTRKMKQGLESSQTLIKRRLIAILEAVCNAIGMKDGLGHRTLHAFRFLCSNILDSEGATTHERELHLGWNTLISGKHTKS